MLIYWIWFAQLKKLSCAQKHQLLQYFRDPEEIYHAGRESLARLEDLSEALLDILEDKSLEEAEAILADCARKGITVLTLEDGAYPPRLKNIYDPPPVLYCKGRLPDWDQQPVISVVGTRKATPYGMKAAYLYGSQIAACGGMVFSGGAAGVDTMALEGALSAGSPVACVFGCGVDVAYPAANRRLFEEIAARGCLISEYPPKTEASAWHFPQRNRILSGLANGVLVVEAPEKSGALITARIAVEQGRDVFVVPGNVGEPACAGSNGLLQDYGIAALSGWDVVKGYQSDYPGRIAKREVPQTTRAQKVAQPVLIPRSEEPTPDKKSIDKPAKSTYSVVNIKTPALTEQESALLGHITRETMTVDAVIDAAGLPAGTVKSVLTRLVIKGCVQNLPGGRVARKL